MVDPITIFRGANGLNIVTDPVRLPTTENGFTDLQAAVNVTIDQSGRVQTRRKVNTLQSGNFHSLYSSGNNCFVIEAGTLYKIDSSYSLTEIKDGLNNNRMVYKTIGDYTYFMNGIDFGIIHKNEYTPWLKETYSGPETHRYFDGPFAGHHLEEFFGRLLIAQDNVIYYSEPYNFGLFDKASCFIQFHTNIKMMKSVSDGLFISTENNTYFISGRDPKQWNANKSTNYPAIEYSVSEEYIAGPDINPELSGLYAIWTSREGVILGGPGGAITNLNKKKIIYPENGSSGFGCLVGMNYIHGIQ